MKMARISINQHGRIPLPLIIVLVVIIGGAIFAFLAYSGVINIPGITPEKEEEEAPVKVEITVEQQLSNQLKTINRTNLGNLEKISKLDELSELKDERIANLQAEVDRLVGLVKLTDENAVRDTASTFEAMAPENAEKILAKYDPEKSVLILDAMEDKKSAAILELMAPDIAAQITQMMAGFIKPFGQPTEPVETPPAQPSAATGGPAATGGG